MMDDKLLLDVDVRGRVIGYYHQTAKLAKEKPDKYQEKLKKGFLVEPVEMLEQPQVERGQDALLYVKESALSSKKGSEIQAKDLEWRIMDRSYTESEALEILIERQEKTNELLSEVVRLLQK